MHTPENIRPSFHAYEDEDHEDGMNTPELLERRMSIIKSAAIRHGIILNADTKVLEVGSGKGAMLGLFHKLGIPAVGIDQRPRVGTDSRTIIANVEQLPLLENTFDLVVSFQLFDDDVYPGQNQKVMLEEISRALKPGGIYVAHMEEFNPENTGDIDTIGDLVREEPSEGGEAQVFVKQEHSVNLPQ